MTERHRPPEGDKKWTRIIWQLFALVVVLVLYGAGITVAYLHGSHAITCVNDSLGSRNAPSSRDANAHIAEAKALQAFLRALANPDQSARVKAFSEFTHAQDKYVSILVRDQKVRDAHPLGRC